MLRRIGVPSAGPAWLNRDGRTVVNRTNTGVNEIVMSDHIHIRPADYTWRDIVRISCGVVMILLGILGLVFPILNGALFLIISAFILAPYSRRIRNLLDRAENRFPRIFERARAFGRRWSPRRRYE